MSLSALLDRGLDLVEARVGEGQGHRAGKVLDRRDLLEHLGEATDGLLIPSVDTALVPLVVTSEPLKRLKLQVQEVGHLERLTYLRERRPGRSSRETGYEVVRSRGLGRAGDCQDCVLPNTSAVERRTTWSPGDHTPGAVLVQLLM
jgi:hypothetical protein